MLERIKKVLSYVYIIGFLTYGYVYANYTPAHDGMMTVKHNQYWEMSVGRFVVMYYGRFRGLVEAPWLIGALSLLYIGLAVWLTMEVLDIKLEPWKIIVLSLVYVLNISFIATTCVYIFCLDVLALGLLLATVSVYFGTRGNKWYYYLLAALFMAFSLGLYQIYIAVAVGLYLILMLKELIDGEKISNIIKAAIYRMLSLVLSGGIYYILVKIFQKLSGVNPYQGNAYENIGNILDSSIWDIVRLIPTSFMQVINYLFLDYTYTTRIPDAINLVVFIVGLALWISVLIKKLTSAVQWIIAIIVALVFPIGINCISLLTKGSISQLMTFSYQLMYLLALYPALYCYDDIKLFGKKTKISFIVLPLMVFLSFFVYRFANDLFYYQKLVGEGTQATMTNIVYDVERNSEYDPNEKTIVVLGNQPKSFSQDYEMRWQLGSTAGVTTHGTTITYNEVFNWYLKYVLGRNYPYTYDNEVVDKLSAMQEVIDMPTYPKEGYCKVVGDYMVIKLSE
jgi:hypothetical protein